MDSQDPHCTGKVDYNPETIAVDVLMLIASGLQRGGPTLNCPQTSAQKRAWSSKVHLDWPHKYDKGSFTEEKALITYAKSNLSLDQPPWRAKSARSHVRTREAMARVTPSDARITAARASATTTLSCKAPSLAASKTCAHSPAMHTVPLRHEQEAVFSYAMC